MPIRLSGLNSGLDTESIIQALVSSYSVKKDKYVKAQTKLSWKQDAWKSLNTKIYSLYDKVGKLKYSDAWNMKTTTVSDSTKVKVTAGGKAVNGTYSLQVERLAKTGYLTGAELDVKTTEKSTLKDLGYNGTGAISVTTAEGETKEITVDGDTTIKDFVSQLNGAGLKANYDAKNQRIHVAASDTGAKNDFTLSGDQDALKAFGLSDDVANRVHGQDSIIHFNGAKYTSSGNSYEINGLTIEALAETGAQEVSITTKVDTEGLYNKVKDFLKDYNELINEMTKLYGADSSRGYEPLTSDEKDAMTDTQIEEWEKKIKDSLFRRDSTLSGIMTTMRMSMSKSYTVDGKSYSLSSFGIATLGILNAPKNEESAYHIDGDSDDSDTSNKADKLMSMLTTEPDTVIDFMKQLATDLYDGLHTKMKSTTLSSAYVVYNDKQMAREYSDYTTTIAKWEQKIADMEDSYYKKFAAMESALAKLQSSSSSLGTLLGG